MFGSLSFIDVNISCPCFIGEENLDHRPVNIEIALFLDEIKTKEYRAVYKTNEGVLRYLINLLNGVSVTYEYSILSTHSSIMKMGPS